MNYLSKIIDSNFTMNRMNRKIFQLLLGSLILLISMCVSAQEDHPTLEIGKPAPDFNLPGVDGRNYSFKDFADKEILVIIFTCNHCPTAQSYEDRIIQMVKDYSDQGVGFVAISPNDPGSVRPDELGYTDLGDELEDMKIRAEYKHFNFPYLYDGQTEETSLKYGPVATPHVFILDNERNLRYAGRIDDSEDVVTPETKHDTKNALEELLAGKEVSVAKTKTFGCSIKWSDKRAWADRFYEDLKKAEVTLEETGVEDIEELVRNQTDKLMLINVWATWCGPCVTEFPDLVEINLMYRNRGFEFVSLSADNPDKKENVLEFLKKSLATNSNLIFNSTDQYALIEAVDKDWRGALPYTLLIKPGGEKVYAQQGIIDPLEMKRRIVNILGREKDW